MKVKWAISVLAQRIRVRGLLDEQDLSENRKQHGEILGGSTKSDPTTLNLSLGNVAAAGHQEY